MIPLIPLILAGAVLAQAGAPVGTSPESSAQAAPAPSGAFETADALLTALETADASIRTFHANLVYDKVFNLQDDRQTRYGDLYYRVDGAPPAPGLPELRTFAITFDSLILDGAVRPDEQTWIFDGHWLVEKRFAQKQYIAHEITKPGENVDPLRLGQGPLPIPIGQRKDDILARYDVELLPTDEGFDADDPAQKNYMANLGGATQIKLTPLRANRDDQFTEIHLWYRRGADGLLLPILARTFDRAGNETFVQLSNIRVNQPIPNDVIDISKPDAGEGWDVQIESWRTDEGAGTAPAAQTDGPGTSQAAATEE